MHTEKCTKCDTEYDPIFGHRVCPKCRKKEDHIRSIGFRAKAFCQSHGLYWDLNIDDGWVTIGQSGFNAMDIESIPRRSADDKQLHAELEQCLEEHKKIESVIWESGLLYTCLHKIGDDPTKSAIEDELAAVLPKDILDKIARIFYKYTH